MNIVDRGIGVYGPRKLGQAEYAKQQELAELSSREATVYGSRKRAGAQPEPQPEPQPTEAAVTDEAVTAAETGADEPGQEQQEPEPEVLDFKAMKLGALEEALLADPSRLDEAIRQEVADGNPRKGAVSLFIEAENARAEGPRDAVMNLLRQFSKE